MRRPHTASAPQLSPSLLRWFHRYLSWYLPRHFHGIRVANANQFAPRAGVANIVFLNHASWWDPLLCLVLARRLLPDWHHYAPMDAAALEEYGFFRQLGLFPVEPGTPRGANQFLRTSRELLARPNTMLWLTPQGRLSDVRQKPEFQAGLAALLQHIGPCRLLPLAIEYPFWEERLPEALAFCGAPIDSDSFASLSTAEISARLESALSDAQQQLGTLAVARDFTSCESLLRGRSGTGAVYEYWRRLRGQLTGRPYQPEHGSIRRH